MKRILSLLLVLTVVFALLTACGTKQTSGTGGKGKADSMTVALGPYPDTIDPALNSAVDGASYIIHAFSGITGFEKQEDGSLVVTADVAKELPQATTLENGLTQYVFELKDNLKWSDGSALTAHDFVYAWNRAANPLTGADYGYMFDVIDGYADVTETDAEGNRTKPDAVLNVTASEDGKKLTVVLTTDVPYFYELCAFPAYMPVKQSIVDGNEAWATTADTYIGNGPYKVVEFSQSELVMQKNENFHNADAIITNEIRFAFNDDDTSLLTNFQNGSYLFIDNVPNNEIKSLKETYKDEFVVTGQLGTYFVCFNVNDKSLASFTEEERTKIRTALSLVIDRNYIVEEIGQAGQVPANGFVAMGLTEPDGSEYVSKNGVNGDGKGYYSVAPEDYTKNCEKAVALLKEVAASSKLFAVDATGKVSAEFPALTYITNPGTGHEAIATYLQATFASYGINLEIEKQEWSTFQNTRKTGEYSLARHGWLGDYNDPISFLDMWTSVSGNDDARLGKDAHASYKGYAYNGESNKTWQETYDKIISTVKSSKDPSERFKLMHEAENLLMSTGAISPIYYYTDIYMVDSNIDGFFSSPLGFKYFMFASVSE